jgi:hypothetical protein
MSLLCKKSLSLLYTSHLGKKYEKVYFYCLYSVVHIHSSLAAAANWSVFYYSFTIFDLSNSLIGGLGNCFMSKREIITVLLYTHFSREIISFLNNHKIFNMKDYDITLREIFNIYDQIKLFQS